MSDVVKKTLWRFKVAVPEQQFYVVKKDGEQINERKDIIESLIDQLKHSDSGMVDFEATPLAWNKNHNYLMFGWDHNCIPYGDDELIGQKTRQMNIRQLAIEQCELREKEKESEKEPEMFVEMNGKKYRLIEVK